MRMLLLAAVAAIALSSIGFAMADDVTNDKPSFDVPGGTGTDGAGNTVDGGGGSSTGDDGPGASDGSDE